MFRVDGLGDASMAAPAFSTIAAAEAAGARCWVQTATTTPATFGARRNWQVLMVDASGRVIRSMILPPGRVGLTSRRTRWLVWCADPVAVAPGDLITVAGVEAVDATRAAQ